MEKSLLFLKENRGFDVAMLIARKNVDNFYNKFGFSGNSEFRSLNIKLKNKILKKNTLDRKISNNYKSLYNKTFQNGWSNTKAKKYTKK